VRFDRSFDLDNTNLSRHGRNSGEKFPSPSFSTLISVTSQYGYVGCRTFTLYPLLRPGSFVQIDSRVADAAASLRTEFDRPIYFVELRDGYACSWCDLLDDQTAAAPPPSFSMQREEIQVWTDAEIVGQVAAVAMRLTDLNDSTPDASAKLQRASLTFEAKDARPWDHFHRNRDPVKAPAAAQVAQKFSWIFPGRSRYAARSRARSSQRKSGNLVKSLAVAISARCEQPSR